MRESSPDEKRLAVEEVEAGTRAIAELPVSVCQRCGEAWGFQFKKPITMPKKKESANAG